MGATTTQRQQRNDAYLNCDYRMKLTDAQVAEIRERYRQGGVRQSDLASEFGVSQTQVSLIVRYRSRWTGPRSRRGGMPPQECSGAQRPHEERR